MFKVSTRLIVLLFLCVPALIGVAAESKKQEKKVPATLAVKELPFCALIVSDYIAEDSSTRTLYVLMEPTEVTEHKLSQLFKTISQKYPKPIELHVWVYTNLSEIAHIVTGQFVTKAKAQLPDSKDGSQGRDSEVAEEEEKWARYKRTETVELFRYIPEPPEKGLKTVVLRGKDE